MQAVGVFFFIAAGIVLYARWCFKQNEEIKHPPRSRGMRIYGDPKSFAELYEPPSP